MPAFYPSMIVDMTLLFDDTLHVTPDPVLESVDSIAANTILGGEDFIQTPTPQLPGPEIPLILRKGDSDFSFVGSRVPKAGSVELAGYRQAGNFSFTFDFRDLPIDPRVVRQASLEVHLGTVSAEDFAKGMRKPGDKNRPSILDTRDAWGQSDETTLVLSGLVDEWEVDHHEDGSEVTIQGRDLRGVMLDVPVDVDPGAKEQILDQLDLSKPVHHVIRDLLASAGKLFAGVKVSVDPFEWQNDGNVPAPGAGVKVSRHRKGAKGSKKGGRATPPGGGGKVSFWDMIVRLCFLVGAVPYFQGRVLLIRPAKGLYKQISATGGPFDPTPFSSALPRIVDAVSGNEIPDGPLNVRRMVYGRDISRFVVNRKLGGAQRPKTVRVVSVDGSSTDRGTARQLMARWPRKSESVKAKASKPMPNAKNAMEEIINVPVAGVRDKDQLESIARAVYEEIGRGEVGGTCESNNLASFGGDNTDPDLLRLKPGDAMEFAVDGRALRTAPPLVSTLTDFVRESFEQAVKKVQKSLGDEDLSRVIVATARGQVAELQRFFRVSHVVYDWDSETGVRIAFDFQNFIEVRAAVGEPVAPADFNFTLAEAESVQVPS